MVAFVRGLLALGVMQAALGGCIVASDPDFQGQDECVPFFLAHEADPPTDAVIVQSARIDPTTFKASVPLRSCALTVQYEVRVFVDNIFMKRAKIPESELEVREVSILVDLSEVPSTGCHRVEAYASTSFSDFRLPARTGDVTKITWWYTDDPTAPIGSCETQ